MRIIKRIITIVKLLNYLRSADCRKSLSIWMRQQGELREFYSQQFLVSKDSSESCPSLISERNLFDCDIIFQGPVSDHLGFFVSTCNFYKMLYPNIRLILSTWNDDNFELSDRFLRSSGLIVHRTDKSRVKPLFGSLIYQIALISEALKQHSVPNRRFVFKTRSDQRMIDPNFLLSCRDSLVDYGSEHRPIVFGLHGSEYYTCFKINDQFMFGRAADVYRYWEEDTSLFIQIEARFTECCSPEQYLFIRHISRLKTLNHIRFELPFYHDCVFDYVIFLDFGSDLMLWNKYPYRFRPHYDNGESRWREWRWYEWKKQIRK